MEIVTKWLIGSGMKVNESKTELCLFHHKDTTPIIISINGVDVMSKTHMGVLGVIFDQKLQWGDQITSCLSKANKALTAIKLIRGFFNTKELFS